MNKMNKEELERITKETQLKIEQAQKELDRYDCNKCRDCGRCGFSEEMIRRMQPHCFREK